MVTVHDLRNPHLEDDVPHAERLNLLLNEADAVVPLTQSVAAEIRGRWGREGVVLPHPHVAPLDRIGGVGPRGMRSGQGHGGRLRVVGRGRVVGDPEVRNILQVTLGAVPVHGAAALTKVGLQVGPVAAGDVQR